MCGISLCYDVHTLEATASMVIEKKHRHLWLDINDFRGREKRETGKLRICA